MITRFDYFKTRGKWYSSGEHDLKCQEWEIPQAAFDLLKLGIRPGLTDAVDNEFFVVVTPITDHGIPHLILPTWLQRVREIFE